MSGRGRGKGSAGRGKGSQSKTGKPAEAKKKTWQDYVYYIGSAKQASDSATVTMQLINHIRKTYTFGEDVAQALETKKPTDFKALRPKMERSEIEDKEKREVENKELEKLYEAEIAGFVKRKNTYLSNMLQAYALLFGQCNKAMQNKIQARADFETKIKSNAIELLAAIEEHTLSYQENKYEMSIIFDAMHNLINLKQKEEESLIDYTSRFKAAKEIMVTQVGGPLKLTKYVQSMEEPTSTTTQKEKKAFEQYMAFIYLRNSDHSKYGSLLNGLSTQFSLGQDQYPKTLVEAHNVLSNHRFDPNYSEKKKKKQTQSKDKDKESKEDKEEAPELSFAQMEGKCYCCGKGGHKSPQCRHKDKPKSEWAINKTPQIVAAQNVMSARDDESTAAASQTASQNNQSNTDASNTMPFSWMGAQIAGVSVAQTGAEMRDWILLDSQSSVDLFCNPIISPDTVLKPSGRLT